MYRVVMYSRLPRTVASVLVGGALAVAGSSYQGVFRNPLVSPDLLGVSSGSCVGAAISILLGLGYFGNVILAFVGGIAAVLLTVLFPVLLNKRSTVSLVLSGVIVGGFFSSLLGLLKYLANPDTELAEITYWQLGSLAKVKIVSLYYIAPVILISGTIILLLRWRINVISLGDKEAKTLGINLYKERGLIILSATLLTAASVCISGTIGWIGLVMPHLARMIVGQDNKKVIPISAVLSSVFLVAVDILARNLTGAEIPLSIITGFLGTPFFAYVLVRQRRIAA
jgi:iron complex transport system permease protein